MKLFFTIQILSLFLSAPVQAGLTFFDEKIDYWKKGEKNQAEESKGTEGKDKNIPDVKDKTAFDWSNYLNPKKNPKEFFKEGNHIPPKPFMELVLNPSDENIKNWFAYIKLKNKLSKRMRDRMQNYLDKRGLGLDGKVRTRIKAEIDSSKEVTVDSNRYRFRLYFDSACPHCKKMFQVMAQLQNQGFYVEGHQIDKNYKVAKSLPFPVVPANPKDLKSKKIEAVPVVLAGDLKKNVVLRFRGAQSADEILSKLSSAGKQTK